MTDHAAAERCSFTDPKTGEQCRRPRDHDPPHIPHVVLTRGAIRIVRPPTANPGQEAARL